MKPATIIANALALAGLAALVYGIWEVLAIGTCASGGPYVSARPCPDGTGLKIGIIVAGAFVTVLSMIAASLRSMSAGAFWFGALFAALGATFLVSELTDHVAGGGSVGWTIGPLFLLMGLVPLVSGLRGLIEDWREPSATPFSGPYVAGAVLQTPSLPQDPRRD